jgi:hypothetical protein
MNLSDSSRTSRQAGAFGTHTARPAKADPALDPGARCLAMFPRHMAEKGVLERTGEAAIAGVGSLIVVLMGSSQSERDRVA